MKSFTLLKLIYWVIKNAAIKNVYLKIICWSVFIYDRQSLGLTNHTEWQQNIQPTDNIRSILIIKHLCWINLLCKICYFLSAVISQSLCRHPPHIFFQILIVPRYSHLTVYILCTYFSPDAVHTLTTFHQTQYILVPLCTRCCTYSHIFLCNHTITISSIPVCISQGET